MIEEMFKARSMIMQEIEETIYEYCMQQAVTQRVFADKSGNVDFKEFSTMYSNEGLTPSELKAKFNSFVIDQNGNLNREEFGNFMEEELTQEIHLCIRLLSQKMQNGTGDETTVKWLSEILLHTTKKDLGGLKAFFAKHELDEAFMQQVCYELQVNAVQDLTMIELRQDTLKFLEPNAEDNDDTWSEKKSQKGKLLRLISEAQSNSEEQAQLMTTRGDILSECHSNQKAYDSKFVVLNRALDSYKDALKIRTRQTQWDDQDLPNHAAKLIKEIWTPQIASLKNKIGYLTQQSGKRFDGFFHAEKLEAAMGIFQDSLKLTDEKLDTLTKKFGKVINDEFDHVHFTQNGTTEQLHSPRKSQLFLKKSPGRASLSKPKTTAEEYSLNTSGVLFSIDNADELPDIDPHRIEFDEYVRVKMDTLEYINTQQWKIEKREAAEMWDAFIHILVLQYFSMYY